MGLNTIGHLQCHIWLLDELQMFLFLSSTIGLISSLTAAIMLCLTRMLSLDDGSLYSHLHYFVTTGMVWPEWPESPDCSISTSLPRPSPGNSEQVEMMRGRVVHTPYYFLFLIQVRTNAHCNALRSTLHTCVTAPGAPGQCQCLMISLTLSPSRWFHFVTPHCYSNMPLITDCVCCCCCVAVDMIGLDWIPITIQLFQGVLNNVDSNSTRGLNISFLLVSLRHGCRQ